MGKTEYDYNLEKRRVFFLIDSKSFHASVESVERGLNPLKSILVVMSEQENKNGGLIDDVGIQLDLFAQPETQIKTNKIDKVVDELRKRFGTTAVMHAMSKDDGGTAINRASLVGGHNGGNSYD